MQRRIYWNILLAALALLALPAALLHAETGDLTVRKAKFRLKATDEADRPRDSLRLQASFILLRTADPRVEQITVTIGPETVISFPPLDPLSTLTTKDGSHFLYKERKSPDREGIRKCVLDLWSGNIDLKVKKVNYAALRNSGAEGIPITLTIGEDVFSTTLDFNEKRPGRWSYVHKRVFVPSPPPIGTGGGGGGGGQNPPPSGQITFRVLAQGWQSGINFPQNSVALNAAQYNSLWNTHSTFPGPKGPPVPAAPFVDWSKEIVVAVFTGMKPSGAYVVNVLSVTPSGNGAVVNFEDVQPGPTCLTPSVITQPFIFIAMTRVAGPVTFKGKIRVQNCP
jgi:hypothetical protein